MDKNIYLILKCIDSNVKFCETNNWGQFSLSQDYKEFLKYNELIKNIRDVQENGESKCMFNYNINDKYLKGFFDLTIFAYSERVMVVASNSNNNINSQIKEIRDSFTATIGHELKTPLTSILSMVELIKLTELTSKQKDYIKFLDNSSLQLTSIINDILDFNKLETNNVRLENKNINLHNCIDSAVSIVAADFALVPLEYNILIPSNIPLDVIGDQSKIIQILINLIKNSAKFSPNNGKITISVNMEDLTDKKKKYIINVIDNGIGISPSDVNKLFIPYTQLNKDESRRRYGGTGLGLVISKKLCNLMNGDIFVKSEVGKGTTMTVTIVLDLIDNKNQSSQTSQDIINLLKDKNILIVDDNEVHRITLMQMVTNWEANGVSCSSGSEALALLEMKTRQRSSSRGSPSIISNKLINFNLAIIDYCMPNMNGRDLAIEIKKRGFDFHIIILSSLSDNISGPFNLSFKPINKSSIEDIIKSIFSPVLIGASIENIKKTNDRVLVVDDYESIRFSIIESLKHLGYSDINEAYDGDDAIKIVEKSILENNHYKYIFMDIIMPSKGGIESVLEINKLYKNLKIARPCIIALTATSLTDEKKYMLPENGGMNAYMAKPISIEKLKNILSFLSK